MKLKPENHKRARRMQRALTIQGYFDKSVSWSEGIIKALRDIRHLCDSKDIDFTRLSQIADRNYVVENLGIPPQVFIDDVPMPWCHWCRSYHVIPTDAKHKAQLKCKKPTKK